VQEKSKTRLMQRGALAAMLMTLNACTVPGASGITETERAICRELARDLPTYSRADTPETLASGARFVAVFEAVCG